MLIARLAHAMRINQQRAAAIAERKTRRVKKIAVEVLKKNFRWLDLPLEQANKIACRVGSVETPEKMALQLARVAHIVAEYSERKGGLLMHGALAEWHGTGVILAGPGGVGKTTASKRLPSTWRSLSDDTALIVKAPDGSYWAHPWPTWSRYRKGDMSGSWDVQAAVKLGAIFMLSKSKRDQAFPLPVRQAISELVDVSGQSFNILANGMDLGAIRRINLMRFHNAVALAKKIPIYRLEISLKGKFWQDIEKVLASLR